MKPTFETLESLVNQWGEDKGILPFPNPMAQWVKTQEEVDELNDAIKANDREAVKDAIGDIMVTLIMQNAAWGFTAAECLDAAYKEIRERTGQMVDGIFVKDVKEDKSDD